MASFARKRRRLMNEINVVPFIDVMLVLLIVLMMTAPLLSQGIHVDLPKTQSKNVSNAHTVPLIVSVDQQGRYYVNLSPQPSAPMSAQKVVNFVAAKLKVAHQQNNKLPVFVKGDQNARYGQVAQLMALLKRAGSHQVGLLTHPLSSSSSAKGRGHHE